MVKQHLLSAGYVWRESSTKMKFVQAAVLVRTRNLPDMFMWPRANRWLARQLVRHRPHCHAWL